MLFCAHYDTTPQTPGALDNASGTAVLLELARRLPYCWRPYLKFAFFGAEELGLLGSQYFLDRERDRQWMGVVNVDMVGDQETELELVSGNTDLGNLALVHCIQSAAYRAFGRTLTWTQNPVLGGDHLTFWHAGIPAVLLTTHNDSRIHTEQDTIEHIDAKKLETTVQLLLAFVEQIVYQHPSMC